MDAFEPIDIDNLKKLHEQMGVFYWANKKADTYNSDDEEDGRSFDGFVFMKTSPMAETFKTVGIVKIYEDNEICCVSCIKPLPCQIDDPPTRSEIIRKYKEIRKYMGSGWKPIKEKPAIPWAKTHKENVMKANATYYSANKDKIIGHCDACDKDLRRYDTYHHKSKKHIQNVERAKQAQ